MSRQIVKHRRRKICVGDLIHPIKLLPRDIAEPGFGETDFSEDFSGCKDTFAKVITTAGATVFNGVNTDVTVTHEVYIRFDSDVTTETWVELEDGTRLKIVFVDDLDERHEWMKLICTERGPASQGASEA